MSCAYNLDSSQCELCTEDKAWNFSESNQCLTSRLFLQPEPSILQNDHIVEVYEQHLDTRIAIIFKFIYPNIYCKAETVTTRATNIQ